MPRHGVYERVAEAKGDKRVCAKGRIAAAIGAAALAAGILAAAAAAAPAGATGTEAPPAPALAPAAARPAVALAVPGAPSLASTPHAAAGATGPEVVAVDFAYAHAVAEGTVLLGTAALWKHLGKHNAGWGPQRAMAAGEPYVEVSAAPAPLRVDLVGDERGFAVVARPVGAARALSVRWDGKPLASVALEAAAWAEARFALGAALAAPGSHELELRFDAVKGAAPFAATDAPKTDKKTVALLQRFALRAAAGAVSAEAATPTATAAATAPLAPVASVAAAEPMRALGRALTLLAGERASYFVPVPPGASLVVDAALPGAAPAAGAGRARVVANADGKPALVLYDGAAAGGARASLAALAGEVARVDFEAHDGPVTYAWPRLVVPPPPTAAPAATAAPAGKPPKHVILVIIDSLPAKVLKHLTPGARADTPVIDRIAREGTFFAEFTASGVYSKPTGATIWTSLYPEVHHGHDPKTALPKGALLVNEVFRKAGFKTCGLSANGYVSDPLGYKRGWDHWYHYLIYDHGPFRGEKMYKDANAWIDETLGATPDARLFMMMFPTDPHLPYRPPPALAEKYYGRPYKGTLNPNNTGLLAERMKDGSYRLKPDDWDYYVALYLGDVDYSDVWLGALVKHLEEKGLYDDTLLVVTADHGEEFLEHGSVGHGHALYDEIIHIPLLLRHPGTVPAGRVVRSPADQADLAPTLLAAAGLPAEPRFMGMSLWGWVRGAAPVEPLPGFSEFTTIASAVRAGRYKLIKFHSRDKKEYLYDLASDPGETKNVAVERPIALRYAWNLLSHWEAVQTRLHKADGAIGALVE
ncbi:MAG TPA: sulfatase [Myxococcota bacterium]|nr:sulfatase [Myxococcota bacterium]